MTGLNISQVMSLICGLYSRMLLIHFRRLTASQDEYLANIHVWVHMSSGWGQSFYWRSVRTWTDTEPPNVTGEETVYGPTDHSN